MTPPLDDELRRALRARADVLVPAADPLAGVEQRARRIRRTRAAGAAVALVVALAGVAVPAALLRGGGDTAPDSVAQEPTPPPPPLPAPVTGALDPAAPWPYREGRTGPDDDALAALRDAWRAEHPGSTWTPLFGQVAESSGRAEVVFVSTGPDGAQWGVQRETSEGARLAASGDVTPATTALVAALPGDEVARLLVVAAPGSTRLAYAPRGAGDAPLAELADGVGTTALEGDPALDRVRVTGADGGVVHDEPAPDPVSTPTAPAVASGAAPGNVVDWPERGTLPDGLLDPSVAAYAAERDVAASRVQVRLLVAGSTDDGTRYALAQAWLDGDDEAATLARVEHAGGDVELQRLAALPEGADVAALVVAPPDGAGPERLVVVPRPGTAQVLYGAEGSEFREVAVDGPGGAVVVTRDPPGLRGEDSVRLLDAEGGEITTRSVSSLACGVSSCG